MARTTESVSKRRNANGGRIPLDEAAIIDVSVALFNRKGYHATSILDIANELGCTKAALYYHVESKSEILSKIHQSFMAGAWEVIRARVDEDMLANDPEGVLREFTRAAIETVIAKRNYVRVFYQEFHSVDSETKSDMLKQRAEYDGLVQASIESAQQAGTFSRAVDSRTATLVFFGAINWTYMWLDPSKGKVDSESLVANILELALYGLVGRQDAPAPE